MTDPVMGLLALLALAKERDEPAPAAAPATAPATAPGAMPAPGPAPSPAVAPSVPAAMPTAAPATAPAAAPGIAPGVGPKLPPWPTGPMPGTLPAFPGPGWCPDTPVTPAVSSRASYWNALLWDYASKTMRKTFVQELFGGQWVTFAAAWHPGDKGPKTYMATEAWKTCTTPQVAPAPAQHVVVAPSGPPGTPYAGPPPQVSPYPGPGAYASNTAYIARYQAALTWLAQQGHPAWDPGGIDGKYGPKSGAAVRAFQTDNGLKPDGMAGADTARALDIATGHGGALVSPAAVPMATGPAPGAMPAAVQPYPGPGAWKSDGAYIARYQAALQWLARITPAPEVDPGAVDGKYGPKTLAAVKAFQGRVVPPLVQDGQAGPTTAAAIDQAVESFAPSNATPGAAA